jgi:hypothetical protein
MLEGVAMAREWWTGRSTARVFLDAQPAGSTGAIAAAGANVTATRRELLEGIAARLLKRA